MRDLPIIAVAQRLVVDEVDVPWEFIRERSYCSHQLLRQLVPGRYVCEACPAELLLRPLRQR